MRQYDDHQLKVALAWHLVEGVVVADERVDEAETAYQAVIFPRDVLLTERFCDGNGVLNDTLESARQEALASLTGRLSLKDKLAIVTLCVDAMVADGHTDVRELLALHNAVEILGISPLALDTHLDTLPQVGDVDLGDRVVNEDAQATQKAATGRIQTP